MKIGLIGCGRVGTTLFSLLKRNNSVIGVYDINKNNQKKTIRLLRIKKNPAFKDLCRECEALFFATPDDQIAIAYKKVRPFIKEKKYLFHFSGTLPAAIFPKAKDVYRCSVHPFATFPKIIIPPRRKKYLLFVQGETRAKKAATKIFSSKYFILKNISKAQKPYYHLIGVFASNLIVGLSLASYRLAKRIGWRKKDYYTAVLPLIEETIGNIKNYGLENALSGPLERGDIKIIKEHLKSLKDDEILLNTYKILSQAIIENLHGRKLLDKIKIILKLSE